MKHIPLKVKLSRVCEFIQNRAGRFLHITILPKTKTIELQWGGEGPAKSIRIVDLLKLGGTTAPSKPPEDWGTWVRVSDLKSELATSSELSLSEMGKLLRAVDRLALHREWVSMVDRPEWEIFLAERGRGDLFVPAGSKSKSYE